MKVLHVINGLGAGGAEQSLAEMLPALRDRGVSSELAVFYRSNEGIEADVQRAGFDIRHIPPRPALLRAAAIRRLVVRERIDVVHTSLFDANFAGRLALIGSAVPLLTTLVSTSYDASRYRVDADLRRRVRILQAVDAFTARHLGGHFHAISRTVAESAVETQRIPPERVTVIPRGRDRSRLGEPTPMRRRQVRADLGLTEDQPVVITVGRQDRPKGQPHLVEALPHVIAHHPDAVLLLVGRRGHASAEIERAMAAVDVGDHIRVLGHRLDVGDLLAAADVFAFPSLYEGLGGAVLEAMAMALPVVASDLPVMREILEPGGNAALVPAGDERRLAGALSSLLNEPARRRAWGERSRAIFEARFSLEHSVDAMAHLYADLAAGTR